MKSATAQPSQEQRVKETEGATKPVTQAKAGIAALRDEVPRTIRIEDHFYAR